MLIIPAVDIKDGKCVRLTRGNPDTAIVYEDNPIKAALNWQKKGAKYLHIVDLNGAFSGKTVNFEIIKKLIGTVTVPIEIGGGIRTLEDIEKYSNAGADRIILGTKAVTEKSFLETAVSKYKAKIAVAIDASRGKVAIEGWIKTTETTVSDLTNRIISQGVKTLICTDIYTDGTLKGPNFKSIQHFVKDICKNNIDIIISGGISTKNDVDEIKLLEQEGVIGMIIGKALYANKIKLEELWNG